MVTALFLLGFAAARRIGQREDDDLLGRYGADIVVQADHFDSSDVIDHGFHQRPRRFDQLRPDLFE